MRMTIYLDPKELLALKRIGKQRGVRFSVLMREAVDLAIKGFRGARKK
jgi:hypothetical protein